jgi:hypothetical protein
VTVAAVCAAPLLSPGALLAPSAASAQSPGNAFQNLSATPTPTQTSTTTAVTTPGSSGTGSISTGLIIGLAAGGGVLLLGIAAFIMRDARRRIPAPSQATGPGSLELRKQRKQANRRRAKAARAQRRRNR